MFIKKDIIFAGASTIYGLKEIKLFFRNLKINVIFIETKFLYDNIDTKDKPYVKICSNIKLKKHQIILPLNEYWVSFIKKEKYFVNISKKTIIAARSKKKVL